VVADVNGDAEPDLLIANYCPHTGCGNGGTMGTVGVLLGNGDGTFHQPAVNHSSGGQITWSGTIADVDGDGTFQPPVTYDSGGIAAISVAVGDVNGDGRPDPLAVNYNSGTAKAGRGRAGRPAWKRALPDPLGGQISYFVRTVWWEFLWTLVLMEVGTGSFDFAGRIAGRNSACFAQDDRL